MRAIGARSLELRNLHVAYGKVEAVHDVSLTVGAGQRSSRVIGPNGAGKTTLLAAIMGLLPARGDIAYLRRPGSRADGRAAGGAWSRPGAGAARAVRRDERRRQPRARRLPRARARRSQLAGQTLAEVYAAVPALCGAPRPARGHALRRRAADAGHGPRADGQAEAPDARRAVARPRAADRAGNLQHHRRARAAGVSILLVEQNARAALQVADYGYVLETGELARSRAPAPISRAIRASPRPISGGAPPRSDVIPFGARGQRMLAGLLPTRRQYALDRLRQRRLRAAAHKEIP